jgi:hypothetical protein
MSTKLQRAGLLGSVAAISLLGAMNAQAVETKFGEVDIVFDTTVSFGASMRTTDRETQFLNEANGGPIDPRSDLTLGAVVLPGAVSGTGTSFSFAGGVGAICPTGCPNTYVYTLNPRDNFDGSLNGDDGRLNYDSGDLVGATFKANHDLQMTWQNYKVFARAIGFYDVLLADKGAGDRSLVTDDAIGDVGRNYELLDLFVSADYTVAEMPVNVRVGKQVINWGESTFLLNGLNVFNPIDVGAFRRPGSEIKEALVPVNAIYGSISLPADISLSAYYALDWEPFELDPSGTAFSGADVVAAGSGIGGNRDRFSMVTGSPYSGARRNCHAVAGSGTRTAQLAGYIPDPTTFGLLPSAAGLNNNALDCSDSVFVDSLTRYTIGQHEGVRFALIDTLGADDGVTTATQGMLGRGRDREANDMGTYGISARYYAEDLGGTEFGFYFQNYHSRLPFVSESATPGVSDLGFFIFSEEAQATTGGITGRALPASGCLTAGSTLLALPPATTVAQAFTNLSTALNPAVMGVDAVAQMQATPISDPGNALPNAVAAWGLPFYNDPTYGYKNQYTMAQLNCMLTWVQTSLVDTNGATGPNTPGIDQLPQMANGGELFNASGTTAGLILEYPEDIQQFGMSFNTTLWGWGVQGELSYRRNAPFQVDTDSLTIALLVDGCLFNGLFAVAGNNLAAVANPDGTGVQPSCGRRNGYQKGYFDNDMYTAQIGTTATFTASDWWVDALGSDLGILVTEFGLVHVPDVEDTWIDNLAPALRSTVTQYQNLGCQGTDLPAGGFLALDRKSSANCRPTDWSAGLVLLARVEYNNFMDTGFTVAPQIVYSYDFEGSTPAPYGNYLEDRQSVGVSVTGTLNNNFRVGASYSNFFGGHITNKAKDTDFASVTASYTF